jgi:muconolactone delta-isomerase
VSKELIAFDYADVDKDTKQKLIYFAGQVKKHGEAFRESGMEIGEAIYGAHALLAGDGREGRFSAWVESETCLDLRMAYNWMYVFERSKKYEIISSFPPTVAYLMAAPSVPDAAIKDFEKQVNKGTRPTVAAAKATLDRFREAGSKPKSSRTSAPKKLPSQSDAPPTPAEDEPEGQAEGVKQYRDTFEPATFDSNGHADLAAKQAPYDDMLNALTSITKTWNIVTSDERDGVYAVDKKNRVEQLLRDLRPPIAQARPHALCSHCEGKGCKKCQNCGWWPRSVVEGLKK